MHGQHEAAERLLRRAIELDKESFPAYHDLGRLLVKLKKYEEALPILRRGAQLNKKDPGVHYQLFLALARLKRKAEADQELATFKELDEANKHAPTPMGSSAKAGSANETDTLPPLPAIATGEAAKPPSPQD